MSTVFESVRESLSRFFNHPIGAGIAVATGTWAVIGLLKQAGRRSLPWLGETLGAMFDWLKRHEHGVDRVYCWTMAATMLWGMNFPDKGLAAPATLGDVRTYLILAAVVVFFGWMGSRKEPFKKSPPTALTRAVYLLLAIAQFAWAIWLFTHLKK